MRIWQALGDMFYGMSKPRAALSCYKRSLTGGEIIDPSTLSSIGKIYDKLNSKDEAARWFQLFIEDGNGVEKVRSSPYLFGSLNNTTIIIGYRRSVDIFVSILYRYEGFIEGCKFVSPRSR
jgi:hypothetical protein